MNARNDHRQPPFLFPSSSSIDRKRRPTPPPPQKKKHTHTHNNTATVASLLHANLLCALGVAARHFLCLPVSDIPSQVRRRGGSSK
jgi:hypothetical protein